jgi:glycosyltransferase involved in cell wall biosynthesis
MAVNVFAPFWNIADSYGRVANELADGIEAYGVRVNRYGEDTPRAGERPHSLSLGGFLLAYPTNFKHMGGLSNLGTRIAVTMFESTKLPPGWVDVLNTCAAVIVPSRWLIEVFQREGVTVPVHCVPLGVSEVYRKVRRRNDKKRPYTYLVIADRGNRKGWMMALDAFYRAHGENTNYRLILKSRNDLGFRLNNANIRIITGDYSDERMAQLYARCDCMINPHRGEGFGLLPREFAATGGISITTDWSGTADDLPLWGLGVRIKGLVPAWVGEEGLEGNGLWADPDIDHLVEIIRMVADHRDHFARIAKINGEWVRDNYRWSAFARQSYRIYEEAVHASHRVAAHAV